MFKVDEIVIYNQYICRVKEIRVNKFNNTKSYILVPVNDDSLIIDVPVDNKLDKIRKIMTKKEAKNFIKLIPEVELLDVEDKYIEQTYKELFKSKDRLDLIRIIKTAYVRNDIRLNNKKKLSEKDSIYLKKCEDLLYYELSYSLKMSYDEVKDYIINYCLDYNKE